jgi:hypothetical protein
MLKERSTIHKVNQEAYAVLIKELMQHPCTPQDLADVSGLHPLTVRDLMRTFRRHKIVHIAAWEANNRTAVWSLGKGRDAKKPTKTRAQIAADYRARKKQKELMSAVVKSPA